MSALLSSPKAAQQELFPLQPVRIRMAVPRSRRSDPSTSHEVAERNARPLHGQKLAVLELIRRYPGYTACELAKLGSSDPRYRWAVSRRAADLELEGHVRKGPARVCKVAKSRQVTWEAVA